MAARLREALKESDRITAMTTIIARICGGRDREKGMHDGTRPKLIDLVAPMAPVVPELTPAAHLAAGAAGQN